MLYPQANDFQKPIKFVSTLEKLFFGKESEKASGEEAVEKPSAEKPSEQPHPKPIKFHCGYCGKDDQKDEFSFKRKREERMAKDWANTDRYNPSHGVPKPCMPLPRGKVVVRSVTAWGDASSCSRGAFVERTARLAWLGGQTGPA
jgi:ribosomal protein L44E